MKRTSHSGFVLLYVLAIVALVGGMALVLLNVSTTMAFETRHAYADACAHNLAASGAAWARHRGPRPAGAAAVEKALDVASLAGPDAALRVRLTGAEASIIASCRQGRLTVTRQRRHALGGGS